MSLITVTKKARGQEIRFFQQYLRQNENTYKKIANSPTRNRVISAKHGFLNLDAGEGIVKKPGFTRYGIALQN